MRFAGINYHIVARQPQTSYGITPAMFEAQLKELKYGGYVVESPEQLEARIITGAGCPDRYSLITFDDGDKTCLYAAELLARFGFSSMFYVIRQRTGQSDHALDEKDIRSLRQGGFAFGSHGVTHDKLTGKTRAQYLMELTDSKMWLQDILGEEVRHFAAAGGFFNKKILEAAFGIGYTTFATCRERMNESQTLDLPLTLNRVNIRSSVSLDTFQRILEGDRLFYITRRLRACVLSIPKRILTGTEYCRNLHRIENG